jgi:hypothetical protein
MAATDNTPNFLQLAGGGGWFLFAVKAKPGESNGYSPSSIGVPDDCQGGSRSGARRHHRGGPGLWGGTSGADMVIEGVVNGDGAADFSILLKGTYNLGSGDFNL